MENTRTVIERTFWLVMLFLWVTMLGVGAIKANHTEIDTNGDLRKLDLRNKTIYGTRFWNRNMRNGNFSGTTFKECNFTGSDMSNSIFAETVFINCTLDYVKIHTDELFYKVRIIDSRAKGMRFDGTHIESSTFKRVDFTASDFKQIRITGSYFIECALDHVAMNGSIIDNTLFNTIWKTNNLNLSKTTISGCSFLTMLFNRVNLSETIFSIGTKGNFINQCVFVFSDFNEMILDDTVVSDSYITYPWNSEYKFNDSVGVADTIYHCVGTPMVNSAKYLLIPVFGLNIFAFGLSVFSQEYNNIKTMKKYEIARDRFGTYIPPMCASPFKTDCFNVHTIKSTRGSKFINLFGLSDDMEDILRNLGCEIHMDKPIGMSPLGIIDTINAISSRDERNRLESDEKKRLRATATEKEIANNELQRKLDHAYGHMRRTAEVDTARGNQ